MAHWQNLSLLLLSPQLQLGNQVWGSVTTPKPPEFSEWHDPMQVDGRCDSVEESVQPMDTEEFIKDVVQAIDTEGLLDMAVEEVSLYNPLCWGKAVSRLCGHQLA